MKKKYLKSILNEVYLENDHVFKFSKPQYYQFLNINDIKKVQDFLSKENYVNNLDRNIILNNILKSKWKYIDGKHFIFFSKKKINLILQKLDILHNINIKNSKLHKWQYLTFYQKYFNDEYINWIKMFDKKYKNVNLCLCHNDLHKKNILIKKNIVYLIDWDFAILNYFYFDYASLIYENNWKINKYVKHIIKLKNLKIDILADFIVYNCIYWMGWNQYMFEIKNYKLFLKFKKKAKIMLKFWKQYSTISCF